MQLAGRYTLVKRLGAGGMAEVWEGASAGEHGFTRRVAIKRMLEAEGSGEAFTRMFLDEARLVSQLHHANIVGILDFGVADGAPFQVLEFVDGLDAERLRERGLAAGRALPLALALHLCAEVGHALAYAHAAVGADGAPLRLVHRDVSPQNILVSWDGDVKLSDFGIAMAQGRVERTLAGVTKGKPAYMAPEQLTRGELDGRTDVFALGCVLHALCTGSSPLAGENRMADLLAGVELPLDPALPEDVRALISRAVRRSKPDRFSSAAELAQACAAALRARLPGDARTALREYLAALRPSAAPAPRKGALDALLDPFGALAEPPPAHPERSRGAHALAEPPPAHPERSRGAPALAEPPPAHPERSRGAPRGRWIAGGLLAATLSAAGLILLRPSSPPAPTVSAPAAESAPRPAPRVEQAPALEPPALAKEEPPTPARARPTPKREATAAPARTGTLLVGGEGALRAEIWIDGRSAGFAPRQVELPVGSRQVELRRPDGTRVGPTRVEITAQHTHSQPYRMLLPAP